MNEPSRSEVSAIGHDPQAFTEFYETNLEAVQRFIARRVSDPHLAADLTADVFVATIQSAHKYDPGRGSADAWLIGVARNVVNAEFRRAAKDRAARRLVSGRELLDGDSLADIEARLDAERAVRAVYAAVSELPARDRALVELVAVDGMPVADAARLLGISEGAARVRWHRSRTRIKTQVAALPL
jgi:RNA polymerase sigma-70 factor (ECF subfamily)